MNGSLDSLRPLVAEVCAGVASDCRAEVALCPPAIYIPEVSRLLGNSGVALGAQNVSDQESGAFTGEISVAMLTDYNCRYVIIGHSERRHIYGESDEFVARKFARAAAWRNGKRVPLRKSSPGSWTQPSRLPGWMPLAGP